MGWVDVHQPDSHYDGRGPWRNGHETIAGNMAAERHRAPRSGDRHKRKGTSWRPDPDRFDLQAAIDAATEVTGSMTEFLNQSAEYLLGLRADPPPRPAWAEQKAQDAAEE